jgi:hypothetical protein
MTSSLSMHNFCSSSMPPIDAWSTHLRMLLADFIVGNIGARVFRLFEEEIAKHRQSGAVGPAATPVASARAAVAAALAGTSAPQASPTAAAATLQFGSIKEVRESVVHDV